MKSFCAFDESSKASKAVIAYLKEVKLMAENNDILKRLIASHNIILHGAPGTGKTYRAKAIAKMMNQNGNTDYLSKYYSLVQFHPSYDYTDFIEGIRPDSKSSAGFAYKKGSFKKICEKAINDDKHNYTLIIDEINRGDISRIFGEAFYSIDDGYRSEKDKIVTQYQALIDESDIFHSGFYVPDNLYIIGTMNDIDKGVESMDFAIRRRFLWIEISAEDSKDIIYSLDVDDEKKDKASKAMDNINAVIEKDFGSQYEIGGAYFKTIGKESLKEIWEYRIKPLIGEYCRGTEHDLESYNTAFFKD